MRASGHACVYVRACGYGWMSASVRACVHLRVDKSLWSPLHTVAAFIMHGNGTF